jgi:hypothetical protein
VVGIQIGNEIPGQQSAATISTAAQNLRSAHNAAGFNSIEVVGALIEGQASTFCRGGTPPTRVDYIADHVYCSVGSSGGVANAPLVWSSGSVPAQTCWTQVQGVSPRTRTRAGLRTSSWARPVTTPAVQAFTLDSRFRMSGRISLRWSMRPVKARSPGRWRHSSSNSATYARAEGTGLGVRENPKQGLKPKTSSKSFSPPSLPRKISAGVWV